LTGVKLELTYPNPEEENKLETEELEAEKILKTGARTLDDLIKALTTNDS
jgi:hypothetical protein